MEKIEITKEAYDVLVAKAAKLDQVQAVCDRPWDEGCKACENMEECDEHDLLTLGEGVAYIMGVL